MALAINMVWSKLGIIIELGISIIMALGISIVWSKLDCLRDQSGFFVASTTFYV